MEEIWKDIPEYNGRYQASSLGRLRSLDKVHKSTFRRGNIVKGILVRTKGRIFSLTPNLQGYLSTTIGIDGVPYVLIAHRAVCSAFNPNPDNLPVVNHINGINTDNRPENLEWCTSSYNAKHAYDLGLSKSGGKHYAAVKVIHVKDMLVFDCILDAANHYKIPYKIAMSLILNNTRRPELVNTGRKRKWKDNAYLIQLHKWVELNPEKARELGLAA